MWAEPNKDGGTVFHLTPNWPLAETSAMSDANLVHVIDDDEAVRDFLAFAANRGVRRGDLSIGDAFVETLTKELKGCVITDMRMPDMSGSICSAIAQFFHSHFR